MGPTTTATSLTSTSIIPTPPNPFHEGEINLQKHFGVHDHVMSYAPRVIRNYMPQQHQDFYSHQPFLVAAARDNQGHMWSTLLLTKNTTTTDTSIEFQGGPVVGDALYDQLKGDVGILGIELATKRRNRVNGSITRNDDTFQIQITQSFGNCPQYIQPRQWWYYKNANNAVPMQSTELTETQRERIRHADTAFVATGYRGKGEDVRYGNDASHRGGPPGFLLVKDSQTIILPDFAGNNHFNTLGNLMLDRRMGLTIPQLETGGLLQLSGHAELMLDSEQAAQVYPGALRLIVFTIEHVNELPEGSLPLRFSEPEEQLALQVTSIVQESADVKSFYLQLPKDSSLPSFQAGQHLPIQLQTPDGLLSRTYSLSNGPTQDYYRISVKREPFGKASNYVHDHVQVGDTLLTQPPAGDFVFAPSSHRPLVLLSAGIGVTPVLSMLYQFVKSTNQSAIWIHGARNGDQHVFSTQVQELASQAGDDRLSTHIVYSQPREKDTDYSVSGRINLQLVQELVEHWDDAEYYMCGPSSLMAELEAGLVQAGVDSKHIHYETF